MNIRKDSSLRRALLFAAALLLLLFAAGCAGLNPAAQQPLPTLVLEDGGRDASGQVITPQVRA